MASSISISYKKRLQSGADDFLFSRHGVLQCAEAGHFATPTAPRPASARDSPWGQDTFVRLSFGI